MYMVLEILYRYLLFLKSNMIRKIILIRHGETEKSKTNPNRELTRKGKSQIRKSSREISSLLALSETVILSNQIARAIQSAQILSVKLGLPLLLAKENLRIENIRTLRRKNLLGAYISAFNKNKLPPTIPTPTGIVNRFMKEIGKVQSAKNIILVGHGGALEIFAMFQEQFRTNSDNAKELGYGEFIVLERKGC